MPSRKRLPLGRIPGRTRRTRRTRCTGWTALAALVALLAAAGEGLAASAGAPRLAYVDPGSGSFVLQALVAALAGIVVAVNHYWQRIKAFFGRRNGGESEPVVPTEDE